MRFLSCYDVTCKDAIIKGKLFYYLNFNYSHIQQRCRGRTFFICYSFIKQLCRQKRDGTSIRTAESQVLLCFVSGNQILQSSKKICGICFKEAKHRNLTKERSLRNEAGEMIYLIVKTKAAEIKAWLSPALRASLGLISVRMRQ